MTSLLQLDGIFVGEAPGQLALAWVLAGRALRSRMLLQRELSEKAQRAEAERAAGAERAIAARTSGLSATPSDSRRRSRPASTWSSVRARPFVAACESSRILRSAISNWASFAST